MYNFRVIWTLWSIQISFLEGTKNFVLKNSYKFLKQKFDFTTRDFVKPIFKVLIFF